MFYRYAQSFLLKNGLWLGKTEKFDRVRELIKLLRPVTGQLPLTRIGSPTEDGGYVMPDDLKGIGACISPGVSDEVGFDLQIASMGIPVHMADASVSGPPVENPLFHFSPLFLDSFTGPGTITLEDYVRDVQPGQDLLLQIDIEGAEWRVINSTPKDVLKRFRIIVMEAHSLHSLFNPFGFNEINSAMRKLLQTHNVVHIHPNNVGGAVSIGDISVPTLLEITFHRKDRDVFSAKRREFPDPLDRKNVRAKPDIVLPECWRPV